MLNLRLDSGELTILPSEQFLAGHEAGLALNLWSALAQLSLGRTVTLIATCED